MKTHGSTLTTPQGVAHRTFTVEHVVDGEVLGIEVGIESLFPDGTIHTTQLIPTDDTVGEPHGTGNVFVYEDYEAETHFSWFHPAEGTPE